MLAEAKRFISHHPVCLSIFRKLLGRCLAIGQLHRLQGLLQQVWRSWMARVPGTWLQVHDVGTDPAVRLPHHPSI